MKRQNLILLIAAFGAIFLFPSLWGGQGMGSLHAQGVGINNTATSANSSAMFDISSGSGANRGLLIPRVTFAQRTGANFNPLPQTAQGLMVYQTDAGGFGEGLYYNTSTTTVPAWVKMGSTGWALSGNTGTVAGTDFIGTTDAIDWVIKTNSIERMRVKSGGNVGIGATTGTSLFNVGTSDQFQVNSSGNAVRINNIPYSWPTSQGTSFSALINDGSGNLSWSGMGWTKVTDIVLTNAVTYTIAGLNGNVDVSYHIIMLGQHGNPDSDIKLCYIQPNGDNSTANYSYGMDGYWMYRGGFGWSYDVYDIGGIFIWATDANVNPNYTAAETILSSFTGNYRHGVTRYSLGLGGNNIVVNLSAGVWLNSATNITSLVFNWEGATGFTGRLIIYATH